MGPSSADCCGAGRKCAARPQMGSEPARYRSAGAQAHRRTHRPQLPQLSGDVSFFAAAILTVQAAGVHNEMTHWGSIAYIGGRIAFTALYVSGIPLIRSLF